MSRPTFVCVPGFCHTSAIFDPLRTLLGHYGYPVLPVQLPSVLVNGSHASNDPAQDSRAIRISVSRLVEAGHDVIIILHSYAGVPGGDALQGLGKTERTQRGLGGGVLRIVFVMAWIVQEGFKMCEEGDYNAYARLMLTAAQESGSNIDSIEVCEGAGSCCWLGSGADWFAGVLRRAAGELV
ncbi:hypothetical protein NHQ30_004725 [Ciborinia camelliae]|nr:hypothetical protein NHQ30_004725 [Ciborinia camelliae]